MTEKLDELMSKLESDLQQFGSRCLRSKCSLETTCILRKFSASRRLIMTNRLEMEMGNVEKSN